MTISLFTDDATARDELSKRAISHMVLSEGCDQSLTAPPTFEFGANATDCALGRFRVNGNAIVTGGRTGQLDLDIYPYQLSTNLKE